MLPVNIAQWGRSSLRVEVWNREPFITDDFLGQVTLPLKAMTPESWDEEAVIHREAMAPLPLTAKHECEKRNATPGEAQTQAGGKAAVLGGSGHGGGMTTAKLRIGVCGRTGSGKSTLLSCLFRLVELRSGCVLIDGADISTLPLADLRSRIAIIPQDSRRPPHVPRPAPPPLHA